MVPWLDLTGGNRDSSAVNNPPGSYLPITDGKGEILTLLIGFMIDNLAFLGHDIVTNLSRGRLTRC